MIVRRGTGVRERGSARTIGFYTIAATLNARRWEKRIGIGSQAAGTRPVDQLQATNNSSVLPYTYDRGIAQGLSMGVQNSGDHITSDSEERKKCWWLVIGRTTLLA